MGCTGSKLDDLPAVALCRKRTALLEEAIHHRYALAGAHGDYTRSLRSVGALLHRLIDVAGEASNGGGSPVLPLPPHRKGDPTPAMEPSPPLPPPLATHSHSRSHSGGGGGSHIHFHSDSDSDSDSPLHSAGASPVVHHHYERSNPTPASVSFEQRPQSPPPFQAAAYSYMGYALPDQTPSFYPYQYPYNYGPSSSYSGYGGSIGGLWGSGSQHEAAPVAGTEGRSSSRASPPPPPPPSGSTWDFLNLFESNESYYPTYSSSRSSKEVREEEGIPDLEDEHVVVKELYGDQKFAPSTSGSASGSREKEVSGVGDDPPYKSSPFEARSGAEDETQVVEKNVVAHGSQVVEERPNSALFGAPARKYEGNSDVANEIRVQFERASDSVAALSTFLEVGKLPYHRKNSVYRVSSRMFCARAPPSDLDVGDLLVFQDGSRAGSRSLSSTLQKLFIWEKKLFNEVKGEEKMRILHDRKLKRLRHLDASGAEAHKVDSTQAAVRKLSTKIRIAIQIVESISKKINNMRDAELWPQINELIQGFLRMWNLALKCYRTQTSTILEARDLDRFVSGRQLGEGQIHLLLNLELELLEWIGNFSSWVSAQRCFVKALNGWLMLCLPHEPAETCDGPAPFSPGRIGAPPVFVLSNYWLQVLDRISEREALGALMVFAANVRRVWERQKTEQRLRLAGGRDSEGLLRTREMEEVSITRALEALNKRMAVFAGQGGVLATYEATDGESGGQLGLSRVFEAMEGFAASSVKAYEELHARTMEEERLASAKIL